MKKQLFIIIVALFAISFSNVYGQLAPRTVTCLTADALHPVTGTPYTYQITVPSPVGPKEYTWFVTQDQAFISNGVLTTNRETLPTSAIIADTSTGYNNPLTGTVSVTITWKSFDASIPVFVVIQVKNTTGCTANNMKVFKIAAQNSFTLDIANQNSLKVTQSGYGTNIDRCISKIVSSVYSAGSPDGILNDFGADTLYYEVVASNWAEAWRPSVQLTNINALEHVTVEWTQNSNYASGLHTMTGSAVGTGSTPTVYTSAATVTPTGGVTSVGATDVTPPVGVTVAAEV